MFGKLTKWFVLTENEKIKIILNIIIGEKTLDSTIILMSQSVHSLNS